ncbi:hypothetical protein BGK38_00005 [Corynebacterium diphtheriae]|nr:hypothetical protein BGK38_00005 [Corynebacterium diphtheriae]OEH72649.1 hypothetical protein BHU48_00005 [Corynebacterium diphtheriae]OLN19403.1 hypothetical protein BUE67_09840 [Corynebacterium diphtheriae]OLO14541.1 hypothetical protein BUV99_05920 [Corynebacterium diphtheriae]OLO22292.1 hypothetical protein BVH78_08735 [Corynebacterium diphtheriae]
MKTNQTALASTSTVQNLGLVEIYPDILSAGIYTQLLAIVTSRLQEDQTHFWGCGEGVRCFVCEALIQKEFH